MPCAQQYFLWGNHNAGMKELYEQSLKVSGYYPEKYEIYPWTLASYPFTFLGNYAEISIDGTSVILAHYPIASWNHVGKGAFMLHGHCHGKLKEDKTLKRLDVGWDWKKRPVSWEEVRTELGGRTFVPVDHHGTKEFLEVSGVKEFFEKE